MPVPLDHLTEMMQERLKEPGTFFMSPGWCQVDQHQLFRDFQIEKTALKHGLDEDTLLKLLFKNYTRLLFIDTGVPNPHRFEVRAQALAKRLNLRYEKRSGTLSTLQSLIYRAKQTNLKFDNADHNCPRS